MPTAWIHVTPPSFDSIIVSKVKNRESLQNGKRWFSRASSRGLQVKSIKNIKYHFFRHSRHLNAFFCLQSANRERGENLGDSAGSHAKMRYRFFEIYCIYTHFFLAILVQQFHTIFFFKPFAIKL